MNTAHPTPATIGVLVATPDPLIAAGLRALLLLDERIRIVGEIARVGDVGDTLRRLRPDVVITDHRGETGVASVLIAAAPECPLVAITEAGGNQIEELLRAGVRGVVAIESVAEELSNAVDRVNRGESFLSPALLGPVVAQYRDGEVPGAAALTDRNADDFDAMILRTKLHRPAPPDDLLTRPHLIERLDAGRNRPLTLVSAPAGYGKSVVVSEWLAGSDWRSAWLSLDEDDGSLRQFLRYFVAVVRTAAPGCCGSVADLEGAAVLPPIDRLAKLLGNELDMIDEPLLVVLDDYHRIEATSPVHDLLSALMAHPPLALHLVIVSRRDPPLPLTALRARGQVSEIRMHDLIFGADEGVTMVEKISGAALGTNDREMLREELEGWAVGLRLLSIALRLSADPDGVLARLSRSGIQQVRSYLGQEVLAQLDSRTLDWLLAASIVDRFCAELCGSLCATENEVDATAGPTLNGRLFIETLQRQNLFVIALGDEDDWFRFHHEFQHELQRELEARRTQDEVARLHSRASDWFESHGFIEEAIDHALLAGDEIAAARMVESRCFAVLNEDRGLVAARWLEKLPAAIRQQSPELLLVEARIADQRYQFLEMAAVAERVEILLQERTGQQDAGLAGEIAFFRGIGQFWEGRTAESRRSLTSALEQPLIDGGLMQGDRYLMLALAMAMDGARESAIALLQNGDKAAHRGSVVLRARFVAGFAYLRIFEGDLHEARSNARQLQTLTGTDERYVYARSWGDYLHGCVSLQSYELADASVHLQSVRGERYVTHRRAALDAMAGLALTHQLQGDSVRADRLAEELSAFEVTDSASMGEVAGSLTARLALLQGNLSKALQYLPPVNRDLIPAEVFLWVEVPPLTRARVLITEGSTQSLTEADELLRDLRVRLARWHYLNQTIEVAVLQSLTFAKQRRPIDAVQMLDDALALARPGGWIRPFVELGETMAELLGQLPADHSEARFVDRLLSNFVASGDPQPAALPQRAEPTLIEPLTNRELDILELLGLRLQNKEIAARLNVSVETVKSHLKNLYEKLAVHNRREAVAKAAGLLT